ncbi:MAG TPA: hypothetical protein VM012_07895 [Flavitalea sp.]|nr:hypothetical protein [Flavitalea sp.]
MKLLFFLLFAGAGFQLFAQQEGAGIFGVHQDIGNPAIKGNVTFDPLTQIYTIRAAGYNVWFERDEFHYAHKKIGGDFILTANFRLLDTGGNAHRKTGWMIRESLEANSAHFSAVVHGDGLTQLQWRPLKGSFMRDPQDVIVAPKKGYQVLQLERSGKKLMMRAANPGEPLQLVAVKELTDLPDTVFVGLFVASHDAARTEVAEAWNVRIDQPVGDSYNTTRQGWLGCRLETMNVFDGMRRVIHESTGRFEAPNWMPDGKKLLFNENGSLYTIPVEGGQPQKMNTGTADHNNNDHGISFDGKLLAISHQRAGLPGGGSTVYVLPLEGGEPKLLTEKTPSYWHGWAPNNKEVVYVGQRDGKVYDIYRMSINGGKETQLTFNKNSHVDGPEYSPDGKFIYYNGNQSGTMQLWRMKPDGTAKEQLTFDEYNNWFPHISPDGKWIAFISFPPDIDPGAHPSYKRVMLRLMGVNGGAPKVIAYLYGGQGTINVPSWSPDSKKIAFVSNSGPTVK